MAPDTNPPQVPPNREIREGDSRPTIAPIRQLTDQYRQDIELSLLDVARLTRPAQLDSIVRGHAARWARIATTLMDEQRMQRLHRIVLEKVNRLIESSVEAAKIADEDHSQYPLIAAAIDRLARDLRAEYWLLILTSALDEATMDGNHG